MITHAESPLLVDDDGYVGFTQTVTDGDRKAEAVWSLSGQGWSVCLEGADEPLIEPSDMSVGIPDVTYPSERILDLAAEEIAKATA